MSNNTSNKVAGLSAAATAAQAATTASAVSGGGMATGAVITAAAPIALVGLVGWGISKLFD